MVLSGSSYSCNLPLASHHGKKSKKKKEEVLYLPPLIVTASEKLIKMHARRRQLPQHEIPHAGFSLIELTACFLLIAAALSVYQLRYHQSSRLTRLSQWKKPSTTRWRSSTGTMMNGTTAIPAYDAIIESTENAVVPMSSNTAITASAASPREHGPSFGRECVKKRLCTFVIFIIFILIVSLL